MTASSAIHALLVAMQWTALNALLALQELFLLRKLLNVPHVKQAKLRILRLLDIVPNVLH